MIHAYLAQYQANTLTDSSTHGKEHAVQRQLQRQPMMRASPQHGDTDTRKRYQHGYDAHQRHSLTQRHPSHQGGSEWCQRHEELTIARTDDDITLEETEVADNVAYESRQQHPPGSLSRGSRWQDTARHHAKHDERKQQGQGHAQHVERQVAQPLRTKLAEQCCRRP